MAEGLDMPWAMQFLSDRRILVTERSGSFRIVDREGKVGPAMPAQPKVFAEGQGGLLDVALDPDFATNNIIYWTYAEPLDDGTNTTALAKGVLNAGGTRPQISNVSVIFRQQPSWKSHLHFGSRIIFAPDGKLFLTLGERSLPESRVLSQDLRTHFGKVLRLERDGTPAAGNPFAGRDDARPEIWSYGHRNIQAAAIEPATGQLWVVEHGPRGGDEVNRVEAGRNYGWPVITYGIEYAGPKIGEGITRREGMEQPVYYWDPNIAPAGMIFYTGDAFPAWRNSAFVGGLAGQKIVRLTIENGRVTGEEWLLATGEHRFRDVKQGPDGFIYALTEAGLILRVRPKA
ncbi:MAG: PQQ-dependent sugar dehydrogenase [Novosphingobium sp.]